MSKQAHYEELPVPTLKALLTERKLTVPKPEKAGVANLKRAYIERLLRDDKEAAAWEDLKANPPVLPTGYRFVTDGGKVHEVVFRHSWADDFRFHTYHATVSMNPPYGAEGSGSTVHDCIENLRRNVGANYDITEFLTPGQPTRAELEAQVEALKSRRTPSTWIAP